ncbi:MAG TPA: hypothetical protein VN445_09020 [Rectinemataceae bacterium]|nr:hypothetical protein [Rectinemataceae bacterium]
MTLKMETKIGGIMPDSVIKASGATVHSGEADDEFITPKALEESMSLVAAPNSITLDKREIVYGQGINITGSQGLGYTYSSTTFGCTSYIDIAGVKEIHITVPVRSTAATQGIVFYDASKVAIAGSGILRPVGAADGSQTITISAAQIPAGARYIRATYWNYTYQKSLQAYFSCTLVYRNGSLGRPKYLPFQTGQINFSVIVNQSVSNFWDAGSGNQEPIDYKAATAVLILPDEYDPNGAPVPLIWFSHGLNRVVSGGFWGTPGADNTDWLAQKGRYRAAGFAVMDVNGPCDNAGAAVYDNGCPQAVSAAYKAYQYVIDHYNVDPRLYVIGASAGGLDALNFCFSHQVVRGLVLLSAWTSQEICGWGQGVRTPYTTFFGFADEVTYEAAKVVGYDPYKRIISINSVPMLPYSKHPIKLIIGSAESSSTLYAPAIAFMNALKNAGAAAFIRIIEGADHSITHGGSEVADDETIVTFRKW